MTARPLSLREIDQSLVRYSAELQVWKSGGTTPSNPFDLVELIDELLDARLLLMVATEERAAP